MFNDSMDLSVGAVASVYVQQPGIDVQELCVQSAGCISVEPLSGAGLFIWMGVLLSVATVAAAQLRGARAALREERTRTAAERDAFVRFARRVDAVESNELRPSSSVRGGLAGPSEARKTTILGEADRRGRPERGIEQVREAYRETVMGVSHYETEYDESLQENLAAEFGDDVAVALCETAQLTPPLREALVAKSREAYEERRKLLDTLDAEETSIDDARERLAELDAARERIERDVLDRPSGTLSFHEVYDAWRRLGELDTECEELLADRQRFVHETGALGSLDATDFYDYVYGSIDVTHPVLAAGMDLCDRLRAARRRASTELTRHA